MLARALTGVCIASVGMSPIVYPWWAPPRGGGDLWSAGCEEL